MLAGLDIKIIGIENSGDVIMEAGEDGNNPLANAKQKALYYYSQLKRPVFSCDSGLYFRGVADDIQPGVKVARVGEKRLNDRQMLEHYMKVADKHGVNGKLTAYYKNAICLVIDENTIICEDGDSICSEDFHITSIPHGDFEEGFPLNSISVHIESGKYYNDIPGGAEKYSDKNGFYDFFKKVLT